MEQVTAYFNGLDLGALTGGQLTTAQVYHLVGVLFFGLFGLSALRHGKRAGGWLPAIWGTVALGLFAVALHIGIRGFPEHIPESIITFANPDSTARLVAVLALVVWGLVFLSAHWVNGSLAKWWYRLAGLGMIAVAVWLVGGWFAGELPDEARPWTARTALVRVAALAGLVLLAIAFWTRGMWASDHARWANRAFAPVALVAAGHLGLRWFGNSVDDQTPILLFIGAVASATCLLIAVGAWFLRKNTRPPEAYPNPTPVAPLKPASSPKPLPVALLLDAHGRPIPPSQ